MFSAVGIISSGIDGTRWASFLNCLTVVRTNASIFIPVSRASGSNSTCAFK